MSTSTIKKSINSRKLFTMKLTPEERTAYDELTETHGFGTLASLIRACLNAAMRDPSILKPTPKTYWRGVSDEDAEILGKINALTESLEAEAKKKNDDIEKSKRLSEGILKRQGASHFDIHALLEGIDQSGEVIFDD
ncbi:MAG: hypothetical protein ACXAB2_07350 [Candidatus Hodarchaeales archaeon]|jgi:hypothetical protein